MRRKKKLVSAVMAVTMIGSLAMGTTEVFARKSNRAAWNNAASSTTTGTVVSDGVYAETNGQTETEEHTVYSNVYADSTEWAEWQSTWETIRTNYEQVALTPGVDETQLNFAWYSTTVETPKVKLMDADGNTINEYTGTQDTDSAESVVVDENTVVLYPNKVTVEDLTESTTYQYAYYVDGAWSENYTYTTEATDSFSVLYVGDPQIGASVGQTENDAEYHAMNDSYNWNHTLASAVSKFSNLSFILSAGDQINQTSVSTDENKLEQQIEYAGFLSSSVLRSLPIATTIGNHDTKSINYSNHFNNPNSADTEETTAGQTTAGTDYYFTYGNTLFVVIDTNNYNTATHENVIKQATEENPDVTWKVLMFHQDIYGSGYDHSDSDGIELRDELTPIIDEYGFDAVLQGHDHTYSRTYQLSSNGGSTTDDVSACYDILTNETSVNRVVDPEGTVYFEANSSTGSKYYQLMGTQQDYIAARSQSWRPTYSVIDFTDVTLTIRTYDAATNEELVADGGISTAYTIVKQADKTELKEQIDSMTSKYEAALAAGTYTEESLAQLKAVLDAAQVIYENEEATTTDIASAVAALAESTTTLQLISDNSTEDSDSSEVTDTTAATDTTNITDTTDTAEGTDSTDTTDCAEDADTSNDTVESDTSESNPETSDSIIPELLWFSLAGCCAIGVSAIVMTERKKKRIADEK